MKKKLNLFEKGYLTILLNKNKKMNTFFEGFLWNLDIASKILASLGSKDPNLIRKSGLVNNLLLNFNSKVKIKLLNPEIKILNKKWCSQMTKFKSRFES